MLYVYGIIDVADFEILPREGFDDGDVVPVPCATFAAAVSSLPSGSIAPTPGNVRHHERVLEKLMAIGTVLPMRFGMLCPDSDSLRHSLMDRIERVSADLKRLRGKVEMGLRLAEPGGEEPFAATAGKGEGRGTAYLRDRLQNHHREIARAREAERLTDVLHQALGPVIEAIGCEPGAPSGYRVSCLIARERIPEFAASWQRFAAGHPHLAASMSGPWPPYSFVAAEPHDG